MKLSPSVFRVDLGTRAYELLTRQCLWREQIREVLRFVPAASGAGLRVLDLGCAYGVSTFELARALGPDAHVTGLDFSAPFISRAQRLREGAHSDLRDRVAFVQADATSMPFEAEHFDLAVGHSFLYLVPDAAAVLRETRRVLAPGGVAVFMEPNRDGFLPAAAGRGLRGLLRDPGAHASAPLSTLRFAASMAAWRAFSSVAGRLSAAEVATLFEAAGMQSVTSEPTLGGLGFHAVGAA